MDGPLWAIAAVFPPELRKSYLAKAEQDWDALGRQVCLLYNSSVKLGSEAPQIEHALSGRLYVSYDIDDRPWGLLAVPNALGRGAFDALHAVGVELPKDSHGGPFNAHITVLHPADIEHIGGPKKITERGHSFKYTLGPVKTVSPDGWPEVSKCWFIEVHSPELKDLRKSYGLSALPKGDHPFHITFAVRKRSVLRPNSITKSSAEGEPPEQSPFAFMLERPKGTYKQFVDPDETDPMWKDYPLKGVTYPTDYGYVPGYVGEDEADLDAFQGTGDLYGRFQVSRPDVAGGSETKIMSGVSQDEANAILEAFKPVTRGEPEYVSQADLQRLISPFMRKQATQIVPREMEKVARFLTEKELLGKGKEFSEFYERVAEALADHDLPDSVFYAQSKPNTVYASLGDVTTQEQEAAVRKALEAVEGIEEVRIEYEGLPADGGGLRVYPKKRKKAAVDPVRALFDDAVKTAALAKEATGWNTIAQLQRGLRGTQGSRARLFNRPKPGVDSSTAGARRALEQLEALADRVGSSPLDRRNRNYWYWTPEGSREFGSIYRERKALRKQLASSQPPPAPTPAAPAPTALPLRRDPTLVQQLRSGLGTARDTSPILAAAALGTAVEADRVINPDLPAVDNWWDVFRMKPTRKTQPFSGSSPSPETGTAATALVDDFKNLDPEEQERIVKHLEATQGGQSPDVQAVKDKFRSLDSKEQAAVAQRIGAPQDVRTAPTAPAPESEAKPSAYGPYQAAKDIGITAGGAGLGGLVGAYLSRPWDPDADPESQEVKKQQVLGTLGGAVLGGAGSLLLGTEAGRGLWNTPAAQAKTAGLNLGGYPATIDRPKGYKKTFTNNQGPIVKEYPTDYGYLDDRINPEDDEEVDVFFGTRGRQHGRFMKGNTLEGGWKPDETKWYANLNRQQLAAVKEMFQSQHPELLADFRQFKSQRELLHDILSSTRPKTAQVKEADWTEWFRELVGLRRRDKSWKDQPASNHVAKMRYEVEPEDLYVTYRGKDDEEAEYAYHGVPYQTADSIRSSSSVAKAIWDKLRVRGSRTEHRFPYERVS